MHYKISHSQWTDSETSHQMRQPVEHGSIQAIQSVQIPKKLIFTAEREEGKATSGTNIISNFGSRSLDTAYIVFTPESCENVTLDFIYIFMYIEFVTFMFINGPYNMSLV